MAQEPVISLPEGRVLPDKQFFRIGEVATLLGVETHVVRFWQQQFPQVRTERSGTGRLLFGRPAVGRLARIRALLYDQGYTIAGAKKALSVDTPPAPKPVEVPPPVVVVQAEDPQIQTALRADLARLTHDLEALQARLAAAESTEHALRAQVAVAHERANRAEAKLQAELRAALGELDAMLTVWPN